MRQAVAGGLLLLSCDQKPAETDPNPDCPAESWVTWETFAKPLIDTECQPCHSSSELGDQRKGAPDDVTFDTYDEVVTWSTQIRIMLDAGAMPPAGGLEPDDPALFAEWMACGFPGAVAPGEDPCEPRVAWPGGLASEAADATFCDTYNAVDGDLTVASGVDLACVCDVSGDLHVAGSGAVVLAGLETVGGSVTVASGPTTVELPALRSVGGALAVTDNTSLVTFTARALTSIGGDLTVSRDAVLDRIDLFGLVTIGGSIDASDDPALTWLGLDRASDIGGDFTIERDPVLTEWRGADSARNLGGSLRIVDADALTTFVGFTRVYDPYGALGGDVEIRDNDALTEVWGLQRAPTIPGSLVISGNPALTLIDTLPIGTSIGHRLQITGNSSLSEIAGFGALATVGLDGTPGDDGVRIAANGVLRQVPDFPSLTRTGWFEVSDASQLTSMSGLLPVLVELPGNLVFRGDVNLATLEGLDVLTAVGGAVQVSRNTDLPDLDALSALTSSGGLELTDNAALGSLAGLSSYATCHGDLVLDTLAVPSLAGLEALRTVDGDLSILDDLLLTSVDALYGVTAVGGDLTVTGNPLLPSADADALSAAIGAGVAGSIVISGNGP